jgi:arylsulfatase
MYKHWVHEGGIATPLVVHWPARIAGKARGGFRRQVAHIIDIMPTCLDVAGATYPKTHAKHDIHPAEGISLAGAFANQPLTREALCWEHFGNRAIRKGDWKLVAKGKKAPWELYDLSQDRSEITDLARKHPDRVRQLTTLWETWAKRVGVTR